MEGTNLDCEQFKCCKLPHIKVWSQTKYARSHVSPTLISVRDLLNMVQNVDRLFDKTTRRSRDSRLEQKSFENYHGATWTGVDPPASRWISASVDCRRLVRNGTWKGARYKRGIDNGKDKVDKVRS